MISFIETSFTATPPLVLNLTNLSSLHFHTVRVLQLHYLSSLHFSLAGMLANQIFRQRPLPIILYLLLLFCLTSPCKSNELQSLLKLKTMLQKSNTSVFQTWSENYFICSFTGVACSSDGLVKGIELPQHNLVGVLPFDAICELKSLEKLSLGSNYLYGSVSESLKNCSRLRYLDLGWNFFTGKVPDLSTLVNLEFLSLNNSGFSGQFPWKSLENLTELTFLSLGDNLFDKSTSFPLEVLKLEKLNWLYLTNCSLQGQIPSGIGNLTELENLELSYNQLSGEIPASISKLQMLWQLELYTNELTGKFPVGFGNLTKLVNFDASTNFLEGDLSELKYLTNLVSLQLFENRFSGEIPYEFGDFKNFVDLSLYTNRLSGSLPRKLGSLSDFNYIDVSENFLTGPIPPDMCKNGKMTDFLLLQNEFTGSIPEIYANCSSLERIRVNNNSLSGTVPYGIWSLPNLTIIDLELNRFEGSIGSDNMGNAKSLAQIFLAGNRFSGELPTTISKASSLVAIELSSNQFSGEIPTTISELKQLSRLHLDNNDFSGSIPDSIGLCTSLSDVNLAGNSLSGDLPASIGFLPNLNSLNLSDNKLSGKIPTTLSSLKLSLLDLSNNVLIGRIPDSLSMYNASFAGNVGLCSDKIKQLRPCLSDSGGNSGVHRIIIASLIGGLTVLTISFALLIFIKLRGRNSGRPIKCKSWDLKPYRAVKFTEQEIINKIKQENLIGKGASGNVYKVVLCNGQLLAVKHLWKSNSDDRRTCQISAAMLAMRKIRSPEFEAEVATLSSIRHVNVVKLYCSITSEDSDFLVYEYMSNGSLWDRIHTCRKVELTWEVRYEISVGAAKGLEYLHHGCNRPVIHRDVKSSNILLDENLKPRIADFGLAKIVEGNKCWDSSSHIVAGTYGYIAPEYAYTYKINEKSDVYSFGVVLMELVTGKKPVELEFGENKDIVHWVCTKMRTRDSILGIVDSSIPETSREDAMKVLRIAIHCTGRVPSLRPSMRAVVQMLEEAKPCELTNIVVKREGENVME